MSAPRTATARRWGAVALCTLAVAACTVGPDFRAPDPPAVAAYVPGSLPAGGAPALVAARDLPVEWWAVYRAPEIDALVRRALAGSPTLEQARARLVQAEELRAARAGGAQLPQVDVTAGAVRQRIDPATFGFPQAPNPGPFNVFSLGGGIGYDFDLFGGTRRELEALAAEVDYQYFVLEGARITLAASVVTVAIRRAALDALVDVASAVVAVRRRQLAIVEGRYADGGVAWRDVQAQRALVAQSEAAVPPLRAAGEQAGHQLAVLLGEPPATAQLPTLRLADLTLPADLPLTVPSELARQRPDLRASEALLHKASANVGVATADLYPKISISAQFSSSQLNISDLFGSGINLWNFGLNLLQPLFRGGELQARKRAAEAAYAQAAAAYRQSVLLGLQNVADVLRSLEADGQALQARSEEAARAEDLLRVARGRREVGGVNESAVLDAERERLQAELERLPAEANRLVDAAALFQALGGGWSPEAREPTPARRLPEN